ncbi:MAG: hypothetical protein Q8K36_00695 [Alphaproteobacteria bacterium]|nr:hypothetical protein [Alphaproteobacteria bacterium]
MMKKIIILVASATAAMASDLSTQPLNTTPAQQNCTTMKVYFTFSPDLKTVIKEGEINSIFCSKMGRGSSMIGAMSEHPLPQGFDPIMHFGSLSKAERDKLKQLFPDDPWQQIACAAYLYTQATTMDELQANAPALLK